MGKRPHLHVDLVHHLGARIRTVGAKVVQGGHYCAHAALPDHPLQPCVQPVPVRRRQLLPAAATSLVTCLLDTPMPSLGLVKP